MATFPTNPDASALDGSEIVPITQGGVDKKTTTSDIAALAGSGSGDVVGPASSTNNVVAVFDGTTGKLLKDGATYIGQTSITTLGTIATGTWNATAISAVKGGTGQTVYAVGDILYASTTTALSKLAAGTNGHVLTLAAGVPTWAASASGMTNPMTTTGDIIYSSSGSTPARLGVGTNGQVLTLVAGVPAWASGGGGGLTNFTEAVNTTSPNVTVPVVSLTATNAATNVDVAIVPKGAGAFTLAIADSTTTGGNKRGINAIDLSTSRVANSQVASGQASVVIGTNVTASATNAVAIGAGATASSTNVVAIGSGTASASGAVSLGAGTSSGTNSLVAGGSGGAASAAHASTLGGQNGIANADFATTMGGRSSSARGCKAAHATAAMTFLVVASDTQRRNYMMLADTTDATPEALNTENAAAGTGNTVVLPNSSVFLVRGDVAARQQTTGDVKTWEFRATIKRGANAAATALVGTAVVTVCDADAGAAAWTLAITANTTLGGLAIGITGEAAKNIKWAATVRSLENVTA